MKRWFVLFLVAACGDAGGDMIFHSSFENQNDLAKWPALTPDMLADEGAPGSGHHALRIGGGCPQPAASLEIPVLRSAKVRMRFDARLTEGTGGGIDLRQKGSHDAAHVTIDSHSWTHYVSESVMVDAGDTLVVEIYIGGIVFNEMLLDNFVVESVP